MRIVITGAQGRLGSTLQQRLAGSHDVVGIDVDDCDLTHPDAVDYLAGLHPALVIHPAAWTDVDGCARDPDRALRVNAYGSKHVALACRAAGAAMLHISSNEVFSGKAAQPYLEYDVTGDTANPYAYSKWVAEQIVRELLPQHSIVRLSWLLAHGGRNFAQTMLRLAEQYVRQGGPALRVVTDEVATPTYCDDLVEALAALVERGHSGIYHLVNEGACSRYDLARFLLDHAGYADVPIEPITLAEFQRPSRPPQRAILRNMAAALLGITLRPWQDAVLAFLEKEGLRKA